MYKLPVLALILLFLTMPSQARQHNPQLNINNHRLRSIASHGSITIDTRKLAPFISADHYFAILHFNKVPSPFALQVLRTKGIELKEYIGSHAWFVSVPTSTKTIDLNSIESDGIYNLPAEAKLQYSLAKELVESPWNNAEVELNIIFSKGVDPSTVKKEISKYCLITSDEREQYQILLVIIPASHIMQLAEIPFLIYLEKYQPATPLLEIITPQYHYANVLKAATNIGGHNLSGKDVVIGIGDDGSGIFHIDLIDRMLNLAQPTSDHGNGVTGAAAGNGLRDPLYPGLAPQATVINESQTAILSLTPHHYKTYGMVITNNSYGFASSDQQTCGQNGLYDASSFYLDQLALDYPEVLHIFAAGNVLQAFQCGLMPANYGSLARGMNVSKNILTIGGSDENANVSYFSKGPTLDHRLKPELLATSVEFYTTTGFDLYQRTAGTSYASPQVAGAAALLYERYRQLNGGKNPKAALIKAALCNGGTDKGNKGPDFAWGFGWLNALNAVKVIEDKTYFNDSAANGETKNFSINVPANTQQLKVTLYWHDQPGNPLSTQSLVNDLDLSLSASGGQTVLPQILDTTIAGITSPSHTGVDHINNIEQVVVDNPEPGNCTIHVKGFDIPAGRQDFFVVYQAIPNNLQLYYPVGSEQMLPGSLQTIEWEAPGLASAPCSIDISTDGGLSWNSLKQPDILKQKDTVSIPAIPTTQARIRITSGPSQSTSANFTIIDRPVLPSTIFSPCEGYLQPSWTKVTGADSFRVYVKKGKIMVPVGTTTDTFFLLKGLSRDTAYWISVASIIHGFEGMRAYAQQGTPNGTTCTIPDVDNDLSLDSVVAPVSGRKNTSTELGNHETIKIRIKNLDDQPSVAPIDVSYQINGGAVFTETINPTIPGTGIYDYSFSAPFDFSATGNYRIKATVHKASDLNLGNNVRESLINVVKNDPVTIPLTDTLSKAADSVYIFPSVGLKGIERWDIRNTDANGRINTRLDDGNGNFLGGIIINAHQYSLATGQSTVISTFNLQGHNTNEDLRFSFHYQGGLLGLPILAVRGSDTSAWIPVLNNHYRRTLNSFDDIELSNVLDSVGETLSSSTQFRLQIRYNAPYNSLISGRGTIIDTVKLFASKNDMAVVNVGIPVGNYCQGAQVPVTVTLRNTVSVAQNNVSVYIKGPNSQVITETVPIIAPKATLQYTFQQKVMLQGNSPDSIIAWVVVPNDTYRGNDTAIASNTYASPYAQQYPYYESFENGSNYIKYYSDPFLLSWLYYNSGRVNYGSANGNVVLKPANGLSFWYQVPRFNFTTKGNQYLESSCLDISSFAHPYFSFSLARDLRPGRDSLWMEYSSDDGNSWQRLIGSGVTTNWYSDNKNYWSDSAQFVYRAATTALPTTSNGKIKLRIVAASDTGTNRNGVLFDDFHVYDNLDPTSINNNQGNALAKKQGWTDIISGGQLIASVLAGNNDLGSLKGEVYTHTGPVRVYENRYLLGRNWVISSDRPASNPVKVRLYFTDQEAQALLAALHCPSCVDTLSAYDFGAYVYYGPSATWNNKMSDNSRDLANYIIQDSILLVPFDKGYYAEFSTTKLGEFWINNGFALNSNSSFSFINFTATALPSSQNVQLNWTVQGEQTVSRYEVQWANSKEAMDSGLFVAITNLTSANNPSQQNYNYLHNSLQEKRTIYYRIRAVMQNNTSVFSDVRVISFDKKPITILYPNPIQGNIVLLYMQAAFPSSIQLNVYDISGRLLYKKNWQNNVYTSVQQIALPSSIAPGFYLVEIIAEDQKDVKKLLKF